MLLPFDRQHLVTDPKNAYQRTRQLFGWANLIAIFSVQPQADQGSVIRQQRPF